MRKTYIAVAVSLAAGFATAAIVLRSNDAQPDVDSIVTGDYFDQSAETSERIRALELAVAEERNARQLIEEELMALFDEIDSLRDAAEQQADPEGQQDVAAAGLPDAARDEVRSRFRSRNIRSSEEARTAALLDAGFSLDRADWIMRREDELRLEALQARFEAQRSGDMQAMFNANNSSESRLREELGDTDYEQYLDAYDRPTSVIVSSILDSSPGQRAGLQAGDQIVSYDGQRVFSYSDLNNQQLQGNAGESVVVDLVRDGTPMQIVLPRGPIGIQAGRFNRR